VENQMRLLALSGVAGCGKDTVYRFLASLCRETVLLKFAYPLQDIVALIGGFYDRGGGHRVWFEDREWKQYHRIKLGEIHQKEEKRRRLFAQITNLICGQELGGDYSQGRLGLVNRVVSGDEIYLALMRWFSVCLPEDSYSPREVQKRLGSDLFRNHLDKNIWIGWMERELRKIQGDKLVVLTDLRFPNEVQLVRRWKGRLLYLESSRAWQEAEEAGLLKHDSEAHYDLIRKEADLVYVNEGSLNDLFAFVARTYSRWFVSASTPGQS
jgi:hypothetical protein